MTTPVAYSIGNSKRFAANVQGPGVGKYDLTKWTPLSRTRRVPSAIISKARRQNPSCNLSPGPGSYDITNDSAHSNSHRPILLGKPREHLELIVPGPGSYDTEKTEKLVYRENPKFSFSSSKLSRSEVKNRLPGPGDYSIERDGSLSKKGIIFGKERKMPEPRQANPDPGVYSSLMLLKSSCKYSFPRQRKFMEDIRMESIKSNIPGPTDYQAFNNSRTIRGGKFFKCSNDKPESNTPGPGSYNIESLNSHRSPEVIIGNSARVTIDHSKQTPGPGQYLIPSVEKYKKGNSPSIAFGKGARTQRLKTDIPGPGTYQSKQVSMTHRTGCSLKGRRLKYQTNQHPGPQDYKPDQGRVKQRVSSALFGSEEKLKLKAGIQPGPGSYEVADKENQQKGFTFGSEKKLELKLKQTPGPGQYKIRPSVGQYSGILTQNNNIDVLYV